MAKFEIALGITGGNEGGLANNPHDNGGFTYAGIASKFWPAWQGWPIVKDTLVKNGNDFAVANKSLKANSEVQRLVKVFYKSNFWDVNKLDFITDQRIADNLYDCGVNSGTGYAAKVLQRACGAVIDGIIGNGTLNAVNAANAVVVYNSINAQRLAKYTELAALPGQHEFFNDWKKRLIPY